MIAGFLHMPLLYIHIHTSILCIHIYTYIHFDMHAYTGTDGRERSLVYTYTHTYILIYTYIHFDIHIHAF